MPANMTGCSMPSNSVRRVRMAPGPLFLLVQHNPSATAIETCSTGGGHSPPGP